MKCVFLWTKWLWKVFVYENKYKKQILKYWLSELFINKTKQTNVSIYWLLTLLKVHAL